MSRVRALKVLLVVIGLIFTAATYPAIEGILHSADSDSGDTMMMSLYATLGIFLLLAARNPPAYRSVILFTAWSSFAHAVVMSLLGIPMVAERTGFLAASAILVVIGAALLALLPPKSPPTTA